MKTFIAAAGLLAGVLGLSAPALAWNDAGQKTACYIAYAEMQPETRARIETLIPGGAEAFADACTWAPDHWLTGKKEAYNYIGVRRNQTALTGATCPKGKRCLLSAIANAQTALTAAKSSPADRREALMRLSYFVGRIHQPLSVGFKNDGAGAAVYTSGLTYCRGNLQHLWTDCMVDYAMMLKGAKNPAQFADALVRAIDAKDRADWRGETTPTAWANESLEIATAPGFGYCTQGDGGCRYQESRLNFSSATGFPTRLSQSSWHMGDRYSDRQLNQHGDLTSEGDRQLPKPSISIKTLKLGDDYISHFAPLAETRLKQAGVRLAAMLDSALADSGPEVSGGAASR